MFCPRCKAEYRPGFIRCSDCDIELVDHLPEEHANFFDSSDTGPPDFVVVATVHDPTEEGQICSFLQANGIPAQPRGIGRKVHGMGIGFVQILVPRELADAARELLKRADRGEFGIAAQDAGPRDFVVLTTVQNPIEEGQICSFLKANGIPAQPRGEWRYHRIGIEILVPRELADSARDLLKRADRGEFGIDASDT